MGKRAVHWIKGMLLLKQYLFQQQQLYILQYSELPVFRCDSNVCLELVGYRLYKCSLHGESDDKEEITILFIVGTVSTSVFIPLHTSPFPCFSIIPTFPSFP